MESRRRPKSSNTVCHSFAQKTVLVEVQYREEGQSRWVGKQLQGSSRQVKSTLATSPSPDAHHTPAEEPQASTNAGRQRKGCTVTV